MSQDLPEQQTRPKIAHFIFERGLSLRAAARKLGCSHEQLRRVALPYDHPKFRAPSDRLRAKVAVWSKGHVGIDDWAPAEGGPQ